jgi:hypothetical protein
MDHQLNFEVKNIGHRDLGDTLAVPRNAQVLRFFSWFNFERLQECRKRVLNN